MLFIRRIPQPFPVLLRVIPQLPDSLLILFQLPEYFEGRIAESISMENLTYMRLHEFKLSLFRTGIGCNVISTYNDSVQREPSLIRGHAQLIPMRKFSRVFFRNLDNLRIDRILQQDHNHLHQKS